MSDNTVSLQNQCNFTMQIRNAVGQIVGKGIVVLANGRIVTHPFNAATLEILI
jgi:hypothetical protein